MELTPAGLERLRKLSDEVNRGGAPGAIRLEQAILSALLEIDGNSKDVTPSQAKAMLRAEYGNSDHYAAFEAMVNQIERNNYVVAPKGSSAIDAPGLPDPLKDLALFIKDNGGAASIDDILGKFQEYPSNIAKAGRYPAWDEWIKAHFKKKGKVWRFIE